MQKMFICLFIFTGVILAAARCEDSIAPLISKAMNTPVSAQDLVDDMREKLDLTDDQAAEVLPIMEEQVNVIKDIISNISSGNADMDALNKIQAVMTKTDKDLANVLTVEQMGKWHELMRRGKQKAGQMIQASGISSGESQE